jgi:hypothetical protein
MKKLSTITTKLGKDHKLQKKYKKNLEADRKEFFAAVDREIAKQPLARRTFDLNQTQEQLDEWVLRFNPGWRIVEIDHGKVIIEEDPTLKKFSFVNEKDGQVYTRGIVEEAPSLDDEKLQADHPDVWEKLTEPKRVLMDLSQADPADLAIMEKYLVPGQLKPRLETPRKVKVDDTDDNE